MSVPWKWALIVAAAVSVLWALNLYAGAIAEANLHRDHVEALRDTLLIAEADTVRLSEELRLVDEANVEQANLDSMRIKELGDSISALGSHLDSLEAAELKSVEGLEGALADLAARLSPEDLPYLRHVTDAQETLFSTLREQLSVKDRDIANRVEEIGIVRLDLNRQVGGRRAADALAVGLREQIQTQTEIIATQTLEIGSLRSAVAPGIIARIGQNAGLVGITAAVTATLVLLMR